MSQLSYVTGTHNAKVGYDGGYFSQNRHNAANDLLGVALDPNTQIQESKAGSCDIVAGRRPRGQALLDLVAGHQRRAGVTVDTDNVPRVTDPAAERVTPRPDGDTTGEEGMSRW